MEDHSELIFLPQDRNMEPVKNKSFMEIVEKEELINPGKRHSSEKIKIEKNN